MEKSVGIIEPFTAFLLLGVFSCILSFLSEHLSLLQPLQISSKLLTNNTLYTEVWVGELFCMCSSVLLRNDIHLTLFSFCHVCYIAAELQLNQNDSSTVQKHPSAEILLKWQPSLTNAEKWSHSTLNNISIHVMGRCFTVLLQHFNNSNVLQQRHVKWTKITHNIQNITQ